MADSTTRDTKSPRGPPVSCQLPCCTEHRRLTTVNLNHQNISVPPPGPALPQYNWPIQGANVYGQPVSNVQLPDSWKFVPRYTSYIPVQYRPPSFSHFATFNPYSTQPLDLGQPTYIDHSHNNPFYDYGQFMPGNTTNAAPNPTPPPRYCMPMRVPSPTMTAPLPQATAQRMAFPVNFSNPQPSKQLFTAGVKPELSTKVKKIKRTTSTGNVRKPYTRPIAPKTHEKKRKPSSIVLNPNTTNETVTPQPASSTFPPASSRPYSFDPPVLMNTLTYHVPSKSMDPNFPNKLTMGENGRDFTVGTPGIFRESLDFPSPRYPPLMPRQFMSPQQENMNNQGSAEVVEEEAINLSHKSDDNNNIKKDEKVQETVLDLAPNGPHHKAEQTEIIDLISDEDATKDQVLDFHMSNIAVPADTKIDAEKVEEPIVPTTTTTTTTLVENPGWTIELEPISPPASPCKNWKPGAADFLESGQMLHVEGDFLDPEPRYYTKDLVELSKGSTLGQSVQHPTDFITGPTRLEPIMTFLTPISPQENAQHILALSDHQNSPFSFIPRRGLGPSLDELEPSLPLPANYHEPRSYQVIQLPARNCLPELQQEEVSTSSAKPKRQRNLYTEQEEAVLLEWYETRTTIACPSDLQDLALRTGLTLTQVKAWITNQRRREKRKRKRLEEEVDAALRSVRQRMELDGEI